MLLVLNAGSSSIKFALYRLPLSGKPDHEGQIAGIGREQHFSVDRKQQPIAHAIADHTAGIALLLNWLEGQGHSEKLAGVGHRVVHGGSQFTHPLRIDDKAIEALAALNPLAPHHQPHNIAAIRAVAARLPRLPQIACFDTAFHATIPEEARRLPLPAEYEVRGIRRYGFHGLSYEYIAGVLPSIVGKEIAAGKVIVAHLGAGASMCAMQNGRSVATTMGFTALDGLPMSHRCGALDPGVVLYLMQEKGLSAELVSKMLYNESGLFGVSGGFSGDMQALLASDDAFAAEAVDMFVYRIGRELGSLAAAMGGMDALVFTAGIGEHAAEIRRRVCLGAGWLGIELDAKANHDGANCISTAQSMASAWVIPTNEDLMIARHTQQIMAG